MRFAVLIFVLALAGIPLSASSQTIQGIGQSGLRGPKQTLGINSAHVGYGQICAETQEQVIQLAGAHTTSPAAIINRLRDSTSSQSPFVDDWGNATPPVGGSGGSAPASMHERIGAMAVAGEWTEVVDLIFESCEAPRLKQQQNSGLAIMCIGAQAQANCRTSADCRRAVRVRVAREFRI